MSLFSTLLYPTDFSACAEAALPYALEVAAFGEALHLLYVDTPHDSVEPSGAGRRLDELVGAVQTHTVTAVERDLAPGVAILHYAEQHDVDLIVMGTHGRRGLSRLLLGSTAREVVQLAPCPVLTVRRGPAGAPPSRLQDGGVLVAIDFSDTSREALRHAVRLADALDLRLDLLHVIEDLFRPVGYGYTLRSVYDVEPDIEERLAEAMGVFRQEVASDFRNYGPIEILPGPPAKAIVEVADRLGSGLIVLGTKGRRGFDHLVLGSVAEAVIRTAPCPVLSIKTPAAADTAREAIAGAREASTTEAPLLRIEALPTF